MSDSSIETTPCTPECHRKPYSWSKYLVDTAFLSISRYRQRASDDADAEINRAKCRGCGHIIGRSNLDVWLMGRRLSEVVTLEKFIVAVLIASIILLFGMGLYLVRRYNRTFSYGTGGCRHSLLWTSDECQILI
ncbi:hypothetical protein KR222_010282 [Zaprionus bogoriensis]|nr:hypothetical protein KR222_010282 [Zaprionus bogoriensis]